MLCIHGQGCVVGERKTCRTSDEKVVNFCGKVGMCSWRGHSVIPGSLLHSLFVETPQAGSSLLHSLFVETPQDVANAFQNIYNNGIWGPGGDGSGDGSRLSKTEEIRGYLKKYLEDEKVGTFVDVPCGMMKWQKNLLEEIWDSGRGGKWQMYRRKIQITNALPVEVKILQSGERSHSRLIAHVSKCPRVRGRVYCTIPADRG